jgi:hypothetical protein
LPFPIVNGMTRKVQVIPFLLLPISHVHISSDVSPASISACSSQAGQHLITEIWLIKMK